MSRRASINKIIKMLNHNIALYKACKHLKIYRATVKDGLSQDLQNELFAISSCQSMFVKAPPYGTANDDALSLVEDIYSIASKNRML